MNFEKLSENNKCFQMITQTHPNQIKKPFNVNEVM